MRCPDELELSMYADGALAHTDADRVRAHADACPECAGLLSALAEEEAALRAALTAHEDPIEVPDFRAAPPGGVVSAAALLIALASSSLVLANLALLAAPRLPEPFVWLNPFTPARLVDLLLGLLITTAMEGHSMLTSTVETAAAAACAVLLAAAMLALARSIGRRGGTGKGAAMLSIAIACSAAAVSPPSDALEIMRSESTLTLPADQVVDDTLIAMAETVEIDGTVTGNLIAMGRHVVIRGEVQGQVVTAARTVDVSGTIGGSVLGFGETVSFGDGEISRDLFGFASRIDTSASTQIGGNAVVFGSEATVNSPVGRDLYGFAGTVGIGGNIGRDVNAYGESIRVLPRARIGGDVVAHVETQSALSVSPGAAIDGEVRTEIEEQPTATEHFGSFLWGQALRFGGAFVTGLLLLWLVPPLQRLSLAGAGEIVTAAGAGLIALVAVPIIAVMTAITLIGLPIAIVGFLMWLVGIYFAKIVLAHVVGRRLLGRRDRAPHFALALLVGLVLVLIAVNIPFLGLLINFLLTITGLGLLVVFLWGLMQGRSFAQ